MSEKVKSNIFEIADPETYVLVPQLLLYIAQVFRYDDIGFRWLFLEMACNAFHLEI